jgi:hypothetical protein
MDTFFQIAGIVFIVILALVALVVFWIRARIKKFIRDMGDLADSQSPAMIHLISRDIPEYAHPEEARKSLAQVEEAGFVKIGAFAIPEMPGICIVSFVHGQKNLYAIVYDHPKVGVFSDIVAYYTDESSLTASSMPLGGSLDQRPGHVKVFFKEGSITELIELLEVNLDDRELRSLTTESFKEDFEQAYADEMDWRASRGGPTDDEVRRIAGGKYDEKVIEATKETLSAQAAEQLAFSCQEHFLKESAMSALEWERIRDRLVIIHDRLSHERALSPLNDRVLDDSSHPLLSDDEMASMSVRNAFNRANNRLVEGKRLEKIGEVEKPVGADIYVARE